MKYLLVVVVVGVVLWLMFGMKRRVDKPPPPQRGARPAEQLPKMVACTHCGVHLPDKDAPHDADGRPYCSDAHRIAGPR